jgi:hypothetical protein
MRSSLPARLAEMHRHSLHKERLSIGWFSRLWVFDEVHTDLIDSERRIIRGMLMQPTGEICAPWKCKVEVIFSFWLTSM